MLGVRFKIMAFTFDEDSLRQKIEILFVTNFSRYLSIREKEQSETRAKNQYILF